MPTKTSDSAPPTVDDLHKRADSLAGGLYPHQVEGLAFLIGRRGVILADDMGLGKTRQAVLALPEVAPGGPWLVICPASVKLNWAREIEIARPGSETHIVGEPPPAGFQGWVIVNYDLLGKHLPALLAMGVSGVVFDEAHYLKNHTSQRSRLSRRLLAETDPRPVTYLLTGTPLTSRPRDLFVLLQLVDHPLGRSFVSFARRYCDATHNGYGWVANGASNLDELAIQLHGVMIRRTKEQVICLPPKVRTFFEIEVPHGTAQRETGRVLELLLHPTHPDGPRANRGRLLGQLTRLRRTLARSKVKATIDFVEGTVAQGEKVLVFSSFDEPIRRIAAAFGQTAVLVTGQTPAQRRQELVDRFQNDPGVRVFAANLIAGGTGFNLTAARLVVFNDLDWVPANHWQAEDRAYRLGQSGSVHVAYLVASGTVDSFVRTVLEKKAKLVEAVVEGKALGDAGRDVLEELVRLTGEIAPGSLEGPVDYSDPRYVRELLEQAAAAFKRDSPPEGADGAQTKASAELLELLARALGKPLPKRYLCASASKRGSNYVLEVHGADVTCSCPAFEYRGMCRHARDLKEALVNGSELPPGCVAAPIEL